MKYITNEDLKNYDERYRARLVNSLSGIKSANLVGTINKSGEENVAILSSCFHLGANPPLMGLIFRPASVERHTFENIKETRFYTINHVNKKIISQAHQTSARYPRENSEFKATGLKSIYKNEFLAPFVEDSQIQIGLELKEIIHLNINQTELVIGEIKIIFLPEKVLKTDGFINIEEADSIGVSGLDCYHQLYPGNRYSYAKPDRSLRELTIDGQ